MMRMILSCFTFYLTFHFITATNTTVHNIYNIYHADSHQQGLFYQKQAHDHITTRSAHKAVLHHRAVHPRFRPLLHTRKLDKPTLTSLRTTTPFLPFIELHPVDGRTTTPPTTINLLQILTFKPQTRKQSSFGEYFFQQQLRAFFGHQHEEQHSARTRSNIKTGLR